MTAFHVSDRRRDTVALVGLFLANILTMAASWSHLVAGFGQLEAPGSRWAAIAAATAIDSSILALSYALAHRRLSDTGARPMLWAVGFLTLLSVLGNIDNGFAVAISKVRGEELAGLWRVSDLGSLDWLVNARVVIFRGALPITTLLLAVAVDRVARAVAVVDDHGQPAAREPVIAPGPYAPPPEALVGGGVRPIVPSEAQRRFYNDTDPAAYGRVAEVPRSAVEYPPRSVGEWAAMRRAQHELSEAAAAAADEEAIHGLFDTAPTTFGHIEHDEDDEDGVEEFGGASPAMVERMSAVLRYLATRRNGRRPTAQGMAEELGFSERTGWRTVKRLRRLGLVRDDVLALTPEGQRRAEEAAP